MSEGALERWCGVVDRDNEHGNIRSRERRRLLGLRQRVRRIANGRRGGLVRQGIGAFDRSMARHRRGGRGTAFRGIDRAEPCERRRLTRQQEHGRDDGDAAFECAEHVHTRILTEGRAGGAQAAARLGDESSGVMCARITRSQV